MIAFILRHCGFGIHSARHNSSFRPIRLNIEALEDRALLSTFNVTDQQSLATAIGIANQNAQIDTINLLNDISLTAPLPSLQDDFGQATFINGHGFTLSRSAGSSQFRVLLNQGADLHLDALTISGGNTAGSGAGIYNQAGTLTMNRCTVTKNITTGQQNDEQFGLGGGIFNGPFTTLTMSNCVISQNQCEQLGGGMRNQGQILSIAYCTFVDNTALTGGGGGICNYIDGTIDRITGTTFSGNRATRGGGICDHGKVSLDGCTFDGNIADSSGGGIQVFGLAPLIANCTFANNTAGTTGGAIETDSITIGAFSEVGTISALANCTIVGNIANDSGSTDAGGAGIQNNTIISQLSSTIVALNQAAKPGSSAVIADFAGVQPRQSVSNFIGGNPGVGPMQSNGGPTRTMALQTDSSALHAGVNLKKLITDQRGNGFARAVNGTVDIGAFQTQAPALLAAGTDQGSVPAVEVFNAATTQPKFNFMAYDAQFLGGVRVAVGDVTGDGISDIVTAPGPGGGPDIHVYDGQAGKLVKQFFAFNPGFAGGCYVAVGDLNGDGFADIIVGADAGGGPNVVAYSGKDNTLLASFFAYDPLFTGGVRVASGNVSGFGNADIICGPGFGGGPNVAVFRGTSGQLVQSFFAYDPRFALGIYVATGDINADGISDIFTGPGFGGGPNVAVFNGLDDSIVSTFLAFTPSFAGGVRVGAADPQNNGRSNVFAAQGPGGASQLRSFDALTGMQIDAVFALSPEFKDGVFIGGQGA